MCVRECECVCVTFDDVSRIGAEYGCGTAGIAICIAVEDDDDEPNIHIHNHIQDIHTHM